MDILEYFHNLRHNHDSLDNLFTDLRDLDEFLDGGEDGYLLTLSLLDDLDLGGEDVVGLVDLDHLLHLDDFITEHFDLLYLGHLGDYSHHLLLVDVHFLNHLVDNWHHHVVLDCVLEDLVYLYEVRHVDRHLHVLGHFDDLFNNLLNLHDLRHVHNLLNNFLNNMGNLHNPLNDFLDRYQLLNNNLHFLHVLLDNNFCGGHIPCAFLFDDLLDNSFDFLHNSVLGLNGHNLLNDLWDLDNLLNDSIDWNDLSDNSLDFDGNLDNHGCGFLDLNDLLNFMFLRDYLFDF